MPPHPLSRFPFFKQYGKNFLSIGLMTATLVLTGCASTGTQQQASLLIDAEFAELDEVLHPNYEFGVESDPLGSLLAKRQRSDITLLSKPATRRSSAQVSVPQDTEAKGFANTALSFLGVKYRFGGDAPSTGFDCSGLVSYAASKSLGLKLPRTSADLAKQGESVSRGELQKGDLVFFNTRGQRFSHVGIYLGEGKFVHSPRSGSVVRVESMHTNYWKKRYNGARRLAAAASEEATADNPRLKSTK